MMVREASGRASVNLGGIAEVFETLLSHIWDKSVFCYAAHSKMAMCRLRRHGCKITSAGSICRPILKEGELTMKNTMKKLTALAAASALTLSLAACGGETASTPAPTGSAGAENTATGSEGYKVAVVRQLDHASMNEIRDAITAELDAKASELGVEISYEDFNGNNDPSTLAQIGAQIIADGYDAIIPIGTTAAQQMAAVAEESETPVIYGTVSYPEVAGLTGISYVTGTSDALNVELLLDMMLAQNPNVETVGLLYSTSEVNSAPAIETAKAYLDEKGISYIDKTGNTTDEIVAAVNSMLDQVDAVFTPTDNVVQAAELAIAPTLIEAGIPHYAGADSFVRNGAFATCGVNYSDLGAQTADLAVEVLQSGTVPTDFITVSGDIITVNTETAAALGVDYTMFQDMGASLVEVQTSQE